MEMGANQNLTAVVGLYFTPFEEKEIARACIADRRDGAHLERRVVHWDFGGQRITDHNIVRGVDPLIPITDKPDGFTYVKAGFVSKS